MEGASNVWSDVTHNSSHEIYVLSWEEFSQVIVAGVPDEPVEWAQLRRSIEASANYTATGKDLRQQMRSVARSITSSKRRFA